MTSQQSGDPVTLASALTGRGFSRRARGEITAALALCRERRERVLAHPDLAARLTQPPLNHTDPARWNGYVPPATWGDYTWKDGTLDERKNSSPERAALVDICAEALRRETAG